jgi:hypothetical protein
VVLPALESLGRHPHPSAAPALLLVLHGSVMRTRAEHWAIAGAARARADLAIPVIRACPSKASGSRAGSRRPRCWKPRA